MSLRIDDLYVPAGDLMTKQEPSTDHAWDTLRRTFAAVRPDESDVGNQVRAGAVGRFHEETGLQLRQARPSHS